MVLRGVDGALPGARAGPRATISYAMDPALGERGRVKRDGDERPRLRNDVVWTRLVDDLERSVDAVATGRDNRQSRVEELRRSRRRSGARCRRHHAEVRSDDRAARTVPRGVPKTAEPLGADPVALGHERRLVGDAAHAALLHARSAQDREAAAITLFGEGCRAAQQWQFTGRKIYKTSKCRRCFSARVAD